MNAREEFLAQLRRTSDRLRSMTTAQLERENRIPTVRALLEQMAITTHPGIAVPALAPSALGDQLIVIGTEFAKVANEVLLETAAGALRDFRKSL